MELVKSPITWVETLDGRIHNVAGVEVSVYSGQTMRFFESHFGNIVGGPAELYSDSELRRMFWSMIKTGTWTETDDYWACVRERFWIATLNGQSFKTVVANCWACGGTPRDAIVNALRASRE